METKKDRKVNKQAAKLKERQRKLLALHAKHKEKEGKQPKPTQPKQQPPPQQSASANTPQQPSNPQSQDQSPQQTFNFTQPITTTKQQIEFTFIQPAQTMYHSLKSLLSHYSSLTGNRVHELADRICSHHQYGVAIIEDEVEEDGLDSVFSIVTLLMVDGSELMRAVREHFVGKCKAHCKDYKTVLKQIEGKSLGLLVNQRFVNLPPKLVPIQHTVFANDHSELKKKNPKLFKQLNCDYLLVMGQGSKDPESKRITEPADLLYKKFEDSVFMQQSLGWWVFPNEGQLIGKEQGLCLEYIIDSKSYFKLTQSLASLVTQ